MNNEELLAELEKERKELESEFIQLGKEIKNCKDSEERKNLQDLKKEIQFDLDDIKLQIEELKNESNEETITNNLKNAENETIAD
jgi:hypothetical protein